MRLSRFTLALFIFGISTGVASAGSFSFQGIFTQDDQLEIFTFTAPTSSFTVRTWSYAGGTNAASTPILSGGFDPIVSVFAGLLPTSQLKGSNNDGVGVATDPTTGGAFDSLLSISGLNPGSTYSVVLSQDDNSPLGTTYGDGFSRTGQGNFTASNFGCPGTAPFCDPTAAQRNGHWALDITGVGSATDTTAGAAPEPASILLLAAGVAGLALLRRRNAEVR